MHPQRHPIPYNPMKSFPFAIQMRHKGRNACAACKKAHMKCTYEQGKQSCCRCLRRRKSCSRSPNSSQPSAEDASTTTANIHQDTLGYQILSEPHHSGQLASQAMWVDPSHLHAVGHGQAAQPNTYYTEYNQVPSWFVPVNHSVPAFLRLGGDDCDVLDQTALQNDEHPDAYMSVIPSVCPDSHDPGPYFARGPQGTVSQPDLTNFSYTEEGYLAPEMLYSQHPFY